MSNSAISGPIFTDVRRSPSGSAAAPSWSFADSTGTGVYLASTDVLALSTAGVQRVVVDAAGNVGIGTASPGRKLVVAGTVAGGEVSAQIRNDTTGVGTARLVLSNLSDTNANGFQIINNGDDGIVNLLNYKNTPLAFWTNNTERMRIDASGNLLVGTSSMAVNSSANTSQGIGLSGNDKVLHVARSSTGTKLYIQTLGQTATSTQVLFYYNSTLVGSISSNSSSTAYNTGASDYRLKEEIKPLVSGLEKIQAMKPVSFKWKESQKEDYGFIAHELQAVIPEAVSGEKDAVDSEGNPDYQTIFPAPAQMIASLVSAIQELKTELDEAKAKIAALEAK